MECPLLAQSSHWTAWPRMAAPDPKRTFAMRVFPPTFFQRTMM